ncbi:unnamed protein product [Staurois parvus]|uniref:Uncharacterized protein n=1 Tax=Staurois parvus TaxID=386267 RepID=A0ABN9C0S7_9NEOB|nr:unnamed protein product [Staurois parvus]
MYVHTRTYTHTQTHLQIHIQLYMHTQTTPHKKLQYFVVNSQIWVLHSRGRQRAQHTFLALLSLHSAIEQSDDSQCQWQIRPELRACSARRPWGGTLAPTIISTRHWRAGEWKFQALA